MPRIFNFLETYFEKIINIKNIGRLKANNLNPNIFNKIKIPPKANINSATIEKKGMSKFTTAKLDEFMIFSLNIFNSLLLFIFCLNLNLIKFLTKFFSSINFYKKLLHMHIFSNKKQ